MFQGQAMDLFWTHNIRAPTLEEYYRMVENSRSPYPLCCTQQSSKLILSETSQLFVIAAILLFDGRSCVSPQTMVTLQKFLMLLGRYFQIRDDYKNLAGDVGTPSKKLFAQKQRSQR